MIVQLLKIFVILFVCAFASKVSFLSLDQQLPFSLLSAKGISSLLSGLGLDAAAAAITALPISLVLFIAYGFRLNIFRCLNALLMLGALWIINATVADAIYTQDANKHVTYEVFTTSGSGLGLIATAFSSYDLYLLLSLFLCIFFIVLIYRSHIFENNTRPMNVFKPNYFKMSFVFVIYLLVSLSILRGGWSDAPQSPMSAYKIGDPQKAYIAWNAPYSISYYLVKGKTKAVKNITQAPSKDLIATWQAIDAQKTASFDGIKHANVVFVLLESWSAVDSKAYAGGVDATPFFDSLRKKSLSTNAMYANGYRTVQGLFASHCSFPNPNGGIIAGTHLQNYSYACLPSLLRQQGWETHFIQGSGKGIVGAFAQSLGFEYSYGKNDYPFEAPMNEWGFMDDSIYRFSLDLIDELQNRADKKPFLVTINTGTTHSVLLPEDSDYVFGNDTTEHSRQSVLHHADASLQRFIEKLNARLKEPTLVVLMADHTGRVSSEGIAKNSIPFLMYATDGSIPAQTLNISAAQSDVGATVLDWLNASAPWFSGHSLLQKNNYLSAASFSRENIFHWINNNQLLEIDLANNSLEKCFHIKSDTFHLNQANCESESFQKQYQVAKQFNSLTQHLLFLGKTKNFHSMDKLFSQKANTRH